MDHPRSQLSRSSLISSNVDLLLWLSGVSLLILCSSASQAPHALTGLPAPPAGAGGCSREEASSLLRLFHGSSFNITADLPSWRAGTDCCTWEGITCEPDTGSVVALSLPDSYISAELNADGFLGLPRLSSIDLSENNLNFSSTFPSVLAALPNLTHLSISMDGTRLLELPRLPKLATLDLWSLFQPGSLKLVNEDLRTLVGKLPELQELHIGYVDLSNGSTGWCQALSSTLPNLRVLSLIGCSLSGDISCLSQFRFLSEINLLGNPLSSELPSFTSNFSSLRSLDLRECGLRGRLPENLFRPPKLETLDLSFNPLLTGYLPEFPRHSSLQVLILSSTDISGELPSSVGYLKSLKVLYLDKCNLTGQIPESIGNLGNLTNLILASNKFSGSIPALHPEMLSKLFKVDLQNNTLSGSIPSSLFSLPSLQILQLNNNGLSGELKEFPNASSSLLEEIDLNDNKLQGEIPSSIFKFPMLRTLILSFNKFNGTLEAATFLNTNVSYLDLSFNLLSVLPYKPSNDNYSHGILTLKLASCNLSSFPEFLRGRYENISFLDLSNNRIRGEVPTWIWQLGANYIFLNLSHNLLEGFERPLPDVLKHKGFQGLDFHSNLLQGPLVIPNSVGILDYSNNRFTSVLSAESVEPLLSSSFISLSGNNLSGEIPPSICNATYLEVLDLSNNNLSGSIPSCILNISGLSVLNLRGNRFSGALPQNFADSCRLSTLDMSENQLEGKLPKSLANCTQLEVLNLRQNHLVDKFPSWLGNLPLLRVLVLQYNGFYGPVRCNETTGNTFQSIQILDLSNNNFHGELPSDCFNHFKEMIVQTERNKIDIIHYGLLQGGYGYYQDSVKIILKGEEVEFKKILHALITVGLSGNRFEGGIPSSIGKLRSLILLNISGNSLEGMIPPVLGDLANLESLDLSRNMLSGRIPDQLLHLTFLSVLNLSHNQLSGRIPQGAQFSTFTNSSFEGNAGLCGPPLSRRCGIDGGRLPAAPSTPAMRRINWGSDKMAFGLGAGIAVFFCPIILWRKGFFDPHEGHTR